LGQTGGSKRQKRKVGGGKEKERRIKEGETGVLLSLTERQVEK